MAEREPKDWITVNGRHIPIYEGESKQDAYNKAVAKMNEDKKKADIERNKKESDKLNGKSTSSKPWSKWKVGDTVTYTASKDFDTVGTPKPQNGKVASIDDDHAIVMVDGMKMWVDEDTIDQFKSIGDDKSLAKALKNVNESLENRLYERDKATGMLKSTKDKIDKMNYTELQATIMKEKAYLKRLEGVAERRAKMGLGMTDLDKQQAESSRKLHQNIQAYMEQRLAQLKGGNK